MPSTNSYVGNTLLNLCLECTSSLLVSQGCPLRNLPLYIFNISFKSYQSYNVKALYLS